MSRSAAISIDPRAPGAGGLRAHCGAAGCAPDRAVAAVRVGAPGPTGSTGLRQCRGRRARAGHGARIARCAAAIERAMGRDRRERWGPRIIDLDLVWMVGAAVEEPGLSVPHPGVAERNFVLYPWPISHRRCIFRQRAGSANWCAGRRQRAFDAGRERIELVSAIPHRFIVVEGPIGVGKTSLARRLASRSGAAGSRAGRSEPVPRALLQNPRAAAFQTQLFFLFQRARQLEEVRQAGPVRRGARRRLPAREGPPVRARHAR